MPGDGQRADDSERPRPESIYAPGAKRGGSGVRLHLGVKDLLYVVGLIGPAALWLASRSPPTEPEIAKTDRATAIASAVAVATTPLLSRIEALEREKKKNGKRWDGLDAFHDQLYPRKANKTPPPKFGPRAEAFGEIPAHSFDPDPE